MLIAILIAVVFLVALSNIAASWAASKWTHRLKKR